MSEHSLDSLSFISTASSEEFDPAPRNIGGVEVKYVSKPVKFDIIEYMMSPKQPNTKPAEEQIFASTSKFPVMNGRSLDLWNVSEQEVKERVNKEYTKGPQNDADVKSLKITKPLPESGVSPKSASLAGTFLEFHTNYKVFVLLSFFNFDCVITKRKLDYRFGWNQNPCMDIVKKRWK